MNELIKVYIFPSIYKFSDMFYTLVYLHKKQEKIQKWLQALHSLQLYFTSSTYSFSCLSKTMSQPQVHHLRTICNESNNFTRPSSYYSNRSSLLTSLRSRSSVLPGTYAGITRDRSPDSVYGMYFCRGDINKTTCSVCVRTATRQIAQNCTYQKEAFTYYEECVVRVSDYSFFGLLEGPTATLYSPLNFSFKSSFEQTFSRKMDKLILRAATMSLSPKPYFVLDRERVTEFGSSYRFDSVVQCSPDLDPTNCTVCLRSAVQKLMGCCRLAAGLVRPISSFLNVS